MAKHSLATGLQASSAPYKGGACATNKATGKRFKKTISSSKLFEFDRKLDYRFVVGADEAGRGSLAGPIVAAAVLFDYERLGRGELSQLLRLNDSKVHSSESRDELFPAVLSAASKVAVVSFCPATIDEKGLHNTNIEALRLSLARVACPGCICLSDGFEVPNFGYPCEGLIDGDARSAAIAAASVVAKVTRDRFMCRADEMFPGWGFARHVGYSTAEHRAAIKLKGVSPIHRLSFRSVAYQQLDLEAA